MLKRDLIKSTVNKAISYSPSGVACIFVPITNQIGAKTYKTKAKRDDCYGRQKKAAKIGLGPEVYGKFTIKAQEKIIHEDYEYRPGDKIYGYLTEIVKIDNNWVNDTQMRKLRNELRAIDFDFYDYGSNNVGFKNGKLVCVDFGYD